MHFPLWQYLNQPLWSRHRAAILNPRKYWQRYQRQYLNGCLSNAFLEQCWQISYSDFVSHHHGFCCRNALEEEPRWLLERCWKLQRRDRFCRHPENPRRFP
ncbi:hypothetical protein [Sphaerothrix gracilis]|uniref:hypothetical protein n=1 Tax=Sphaerothrix gracilis TaxID=3151835 RepID=UPI0031FCFBC6